MGGFASTGSSICAPRMRAELRDRFLVLRVAAGSEAEERPVAASHGKEDPQPVVGEGPEAGADPLDLLDDRVQALGGPVGGTGGVPGQDLAAPSLEGAGDTSNLWRPSFPAVLDEPIDPAAGELGLAVEGVEIGRSYRSSRGRKGGVVGSQGPEDLASEVALQATDDLLLGATLGDTALHIGLGPRAVAHPNDDGDVQRPVR